MAEIGIIGAGSWGTALAVLCVNNGHDVTVWSRRTKRDAHKKDSRLPGVEIPDAICFTTDLSEAMKGKGAVMSCGSLSVIFGKFPEKCGLLQRKDRSSSMFPKEWRKVLCMTLSQHY